MTVTSFIRENCIPSALVFVNGESVQNTRALAVVLPSQVLVGILDLFPVGKLSGGSCVPEFSPNEQIWEGEVNHV